MQENTSFLPLAQTIKMLHDSIESDMNRLLCQHDLTLSQLGVLCYLFEHPENGHSPKDIEQFFSLSHPTIIGILNRMSAKGLITIKVCELDHRCRNVFVAEKGFQMRHIAREHQKIIDQKLEQGFSKEELDTLKPLLARMLANLLAERS